jgi:CRISPR-associated protein Cas6
VTGSLDLAFALAGDMIDRDYAYALSRALAAALPWLADEPLAGVHPIRGLTASDGRLLVGGRTRLVLRLPAARADSCAGLQGTRLELPEPLHIGRCRRRELLPYPVLHSRLVITGAEDEARFVEDVERATVQMQIKGELIVGRRGEVRVGAEQCTGFSLMLHGLSPDDSLRAQQQGLGLHRLLGCGVFVPHKSIAAVGS